MGLLRLTRTDGVLAIDADLAASLAVAARERG